MAAAKNNHTFWRKYMENRAHPLAGALAWPLPFA
jgi:hypothetical protein